MLLRNGEEIDFFSFVHLGGYAKQDLGFGALVCFSWGVGSSFTGKEGKTLGRRGPQLRGRLRAAYEEDFEGDHRWTAGSVPRCRRMW